ncbi:MAG: SulP family inorganic anion transporter [Chloroflexi bacterium]|nr:SulP family inorganic anion transporter [Chloroflexota bacterium]MYB84786.1 SulP family inorganic anion transporter [Chloroflexota bacterium]
MRISYNLTTFRGDVLGGVTAGVVGLPLALAFGVASGLGATAGIYGAVAVGFFAAVFGGTKSQISGPTGSMTVAMAVIVTAHAEGDLAKAFTIVVMAGVIQIALGLMRVGRYVSYTPYSVVSGFMSGIGILIILIQTLPFMGAEVITGGPADAVNGWPDAVTNVDYAALAVGATTLVVMVGWPARFSRFFPATLVALLAGTLLSVLWLTDVPVIGNVSAELPGLQQLDFAPSVLAGAIQPALILALLGSIDSLLTSLVADSMTRTRHDSDRELIGQGIGNTIAGLIGALPGAGSTPGSVVNIRSGGRTQVSGAIRAGVVLLLVLGLSEYVKVIPEAVLAGILIKVGWDIVDWRFVTRLHRVQREHLLVMVLTMGLTVFLDLVTAVAIGLIVAGMASARHWERLELDSVMSIPLLDSVFLTPDDESDDADIFSARVGLVSMRGSFSVASSGKLTTVITADIRDHEVVILNFSDTVHMDDSAALVIEQLIDVAYDQETVCIIMGLKGRPAVTLQALNVLRRVPEHRFVDNIDEARAAAREILAGSPPS